MSRTATLLVMFLAFWLVLTALVAWQWGWWAIIPGLGALGTAQRLFGAH